MNPTAGNDTKGHLVLDTYPPNLSAIPINNSNFNEGYIVVNVTATDSSYVSTFVDWNSSLLGWWRMDDINSSGDPQDYTGKNNGTIVGHASQTPYGKLGKGFSLDGYGDYIQVPGIEYDDTIRDTGNFTVSMWFKGNESANWNRILMEKNSFMFNFQNGNSTVFYLWNETGYETLVFSRGLSLNQWYHIAATFTYDNNLINVSLYRDGVYNASHSMVGAPPVNDYFLTIGGYENTEYQFNGTIDDVIVFDRSLSAAEISALYGNTSTNYLQANYTNISDGDYTYDVYAQDTSANVNSIDLRNVFTDATYPGISFVSPTPSNRTLKPGNIYVNISTTDAYEHYSFLDFNRDLLLWMTMDNIDSSGDPQDSSTYANHGTAINDANQTTAGYFGRGFELDGSGDYMTVADSSSLNVIGSEITLSMWVYPRSKGNNTHLLRKYAGGGGYWMPFSIDGRASMGIFNGSTYQALYTSSSIPLDEWSLVSGTYNANGNISVYVNGVLNKTAVATRGDIGASNGGILYLGYKGWQASGNAEFNGTIDDILIFNRSLTAVEILALYNASANQYEHNFTNLAEDLYNFTGYTVDKGGNINSTDTHYIGVNRTAWCGDVNESGEFIVAKDIVATGTCFNITTNDVILDFDGYNITGNESGYGVVSDGYSNATIKDGGIYLFYYGIYLQDSQNNNITGNTVNNNRNGGIYLNSSSNNLIHNNTANLNQDFFDLKSGIYLNSSSNNTIKDNTANSNGAGIYLNSSVNNTIQNNTAKSNTDGVYLFLSQNNTVENNNLSSNSKGTYLSSSTNNTIRGNIVKLNSNGIELDPGSNGNYVNNNIINSNTNVGFEIEGGSNNTALNNTINSNTWAPVAIATANNNSIINNSMWNCTSHFNGKCLYLYESDYNVYDGNLINLSVNNGIHIYSSGAGGSDNSDHNLFMNTNMINIAEQSVFIDTASGSTNVNNTFLNFTYDNETVEAGGVLIRKWYVDAHVNYSNSSHAGNISVVVYNRSSNLEHNVTTANSGWIVQRNVTEYINTDGTKVYYTNNTVKAVRPGFVSIPSLYTHNLTTNYIFYFMLEKEGKPVITDFNPGFDPYITEPENYTFTIVYSDPNNNANVTWIIDGTIDSSFNDLTRYNWTGGYDQEGDHTIRVVVDDGTSSDEVVWILHIANYTGSGILTLSTNLTNAAFFDGDTMVVEVTANCAGGTCDGVILYMDPIDTSSFSWAYIIVVMLSSSLLTIVVLKKVKAQVSTEYLIITGVVLLIAAIAVAVYGGIALLGGGTSEHAARTELISQEVAVQDYYIDENGVHLTLVNKYRDPVRITEIKVNNTVLAFAGGYFVLQPNKQKEVLSSTIRSMVPSQRYDYSFNLKHKIIKTGAKKSTPDGLRLIGETGGAMALNKGIITDEGSPFYLVGESSFTCGDISSGGNCVHDFQVKVNGTSVTYTFFAIATSTNTDNATSSRAQITIS